LFKRDQSTDTATGKTPPPVHEAVVEVTDAERDALTFTAYDLDVHLTLASSSIAVRTKLTVRNSGSVPLKRLVFQISSSLHWDRFATEVGGRVEPVSFVQHTIDTDADHTGKAAEAVVSLAQPLAAGGTVTLTSFYSGEIQQSGNRLERIGAPEDQAAAADWDRISPELTGLRGYGNVLWYPTAAAPVFLGDGAKLFESVGTQRRQQANATMQLRLTVSFSGDAPDAAFFCGRREQLKAISENVNLPVAESPPGVATADFPTRLLGFRTPSLFVTDRAGTVSSDSLISAVTDHYDAVPAYDAAAEKVQPLLRDWIGPGPLRMLNIIDLNLINGQGQPFEDDALQATPMRAVDPSLLAAPLAHSLSHAWFRSSQVWLDEGVAQFMSLLWLEQSAGRDAAVSQLVKDANTLALAEPVVARDAGANAGQSLIDARDEIYYRTKAAAVLWMLRSIVGDDALRGALQLYRNDTKQDADPKEFQRVLEKAAQRDLNWFFDDWVYRDRGLPDLTIANVTPRALQDTGDKQSWLVSVEVQNDGGAAAEVPVTVRSGALTASQRLRIAGHSSASTRIIFQGVPQEVVVNDGTVPEVTSATHTKVLIIR